MKKFVCSLLVAILASPMAYSQEPKEKLPNEVPVSSIPPGTPATKFDEQQMQEIDAKMQVLADQVERLTKIISDRAEADKASNLKRAQLFASIAANDILLGQLQENLAEAKKSRYQKAGWTAIFALATAGQGIAFLQSLNSIATVPKGASLAKSKTLLSVLALLSTGYYTWKAGVQTKSEWKAFWYAPDEVERIESEIALTRKKNEDNQNGIMGVFNLTPEERNILFKK